MDRLITFRISLLDDFKQLTILHYPVVDVEHESFTFAAVYLSHNRLDLNVMSNFARTYIGEFIIREFGNLLEDLHFGLPLWFLAQCSWQSFISFFCDQCESDLWVMQTKM